MTKWLVLTAMVPDTADPEQNCDAVLDELREQISGALRGYVRNNERDVVITCHRDQPAAAVRSILDELDHDFEFAIIVEANDDDEQVTATAYDTTDGVVESEVVESEPGERRGFTYTYNNVQAATE